MQEELKTLQKTLGITFIFVTHDQGEALSMADRIAIFNEGKIVQVDSPQNIYTRPETRFVADFVGSSNVLPTAFFDSLDQPSCSPGQWASLRPEAIRIIESGGKPATVVSLNYLGNSTRITLEADGQRVQCLTPSFGVLPNPNDDVHIIWNPDDVRLLAGE